MVKAPNWVPFFVSETQRAQGQKVKPMQPKVAVFCFS